MKKMPFRFARRVRNLEIKTYCPTKKKQSLRDGSSGGGSSGSRSTNQLVCPSCVLPIVVAFIFAFTVIQLIVIHRTIVAYKSRSLAFEEVYGPSHNDSKSQGDLLAFSKKFHSAWRNSSGVVEWKTEQSYPYRIPGVPHPPPINHIWKVSCPEVPKELGRNISINAKVDVSLEQLAKNNPQVLPGGWWTPEKCKARFHVALIIPYRFRWNHLKLLLSVLHPMLRRQQMSYQVFVAEQFGNYTFNKGLLMNAAFLLAMNFSNAFDCVIFHDVDLLPETDHNIYGCAKSPAHLSVSIDAYGYRLPYSKLVGGVFAISISHFIQVNGYSNLYWGWGAEDDDMYKRLIANQLLLTRPRPDLAKYKMLQHGRRVPNQFINPLIRTARLRFPQDGLTTSQFRLVSSSAQALFTHFLVDVGQPSYSVFEPHIRLESMASPLSPPSARSGSSSSSLPTTTSPYPVIIPPSFHQSHHHQHHPHPRSIVQNVKVTLSPPPPPSQVLPKLTPFPQHGQGNNNKRRGRHELFILNGIARDDDDDAEKSEDDYDGNVDKKRGPGTRQVNKAVKVGSNPSGSDVDTPLVGLSPSSSINDLGMRQVRSLNQHLSSSSFLSTLAYSTLRRSGGDSISVGGGSGWMRDGNRRNPAVAAPPDIPLDPDVPVVEEDDDVDSDEEDV